MHLTLVSLFSCPSPLLSFSGGIDRSSPGHDAFEDETDALLGNDGDIPPMEEEEEEGEELFGDNFEA